MEEQYITLAHGSGGMQTASLIGELFRSAFENEYFTADDAAVLPRPEGKIAMSTDGFIVSPPFFPGGNIGKLSICGTVNDLACMGAKPLYLTTSFVIEEGYPIAELKKIVKAMSETARQAGVHIRGLREARRCRYCDRRCGTPWNGDSACPKRIRNRSRCDK